MIVSRHCPHCGASVPADAPMGLCVPCLLDICVPPGPNVQPIPDYEILGSGREGGMGIVYRARQLGLDRVVALKMIQGGFFVSPAQRQRFRSEAEAAAHWPTTSPLPVSSSLPCDFLW